mmetsp:Transcript_13806/g.55895  ORF Transcript_13806/g.55895 Transcript_13806/m.55895 type:complete len:437 (-) Transcript_13806:9-1319(-)
MERCGGTTRIENARRGRGNTERGEGGSRRVAPRRTPVSADGLRRLGGRRTGEDPRRRLLRVAGPDERERPGRVHARVRRARGVVGGPSGLAPGRQVGHRGGVFDRGRRRRGFEIGVVRVFTRFLPRPSRRRLREEPDTQARVRRGHRGCRGGVAGAVRRRVAARALPGQTLRPRHRARASRAVSRPRRDGAFPEPFPVPDVNRRLRGVHARSSGKKRAASGGPPRVLRRLSRPAGCQARGFARAGRARRRRAAFEDDRGRARKCGAGDVRGVVAGPLLRPSVRAGTEARGSAARRASRRRFGRRIDWQSRDSSRNDGRRGGGRHRGCRLRHGLARREAVRGVQARVRAPLRRVVGARMRRWTRRAAGGFAVHRRGAPVAASAADRRRRRRVRVRGEGRERAVAGAAHAQAPDRVSQGAEGIVGPVVNVKSTAGAYN